MTLLGILGLMAGSAYAAWVFTRQYWVDRYLFVCRECNRLRDEVDRLEREQDPADFWKRSDQ